MVVIEFRAPMMSERERDEFLGSIIETGAHVDAAELAPDGRGRIEFHTDDMEFGEVRELRRWLEAQPNVANINLSLAPDP